MVALAAEVRKSYLGERCAVLGLYDSLCTGPGRYDTHCAPLGRRHFPYRRSIDILLLWSEKQGMDFRL